MLFTIDNFNGNRREGKNRDARAKLTRDRHPGAEGGYHGAMHTVFAATDTVIEQSLAMLSQAIEDLPDSALDWTPLSGTSSVAVLTVHGLSSLRFWVAAGTGLEPSQQAYLEEDRPEAFRSRDRTAVELLGEIDRTREEVHSTLARGDEPALSALVPFETDGRRLSGAECLVRGVAHLREHVGQAQLMRDLWLSTSREGH